MTDTPETPDDEERIDLRPTGLTRIFISEGKKAKVYRLRRPFFGELKTMRLAMERVTDEVSDLGWDLAEDLRVIGEQGDAAAKDEALSDQERRQTIVKLRQRGRELNSELIEKADDLRLDWWRDVFETLSLDGSPKEMPGWLVDPNLMGRVINHWRTAPFRPVD